MGHGKESSYYFGVHIGERILSKVFKDVERMPLNNPGFDVICNHGKRVDIKLSATGDNNRGWSFIIKHNHIADYFLCVAFDNRQDLTPEHIWLIPGDVINNKHSIYVGKPNLDKWSTYALSIDKVVACFDAAKPPAYMIGINTDVYTDVIDRYIHEMAGCAQHIRNTETLI